MRELYEKYIFQKKDNWKSLLIYFFLREKRSICFHWSNMDKKTVFYVTYNLLENAFRYPLVNPWDFFISFNVFIILICISARSSITYYSEWIIIPLGFFFSPNVARWKNPLDGLVFILCFIKIISKSWKKGATRIFPHCLDGPYCLMLSPLFSVFVISLWFVWIVIKSL